MTRLDKMALMDAAFARDDRDEFTRLLALYPDCRCGESGNDYWMNAAATDGKLWAVEMLVEQGADINRPSNPTDSVPSPEGPIVEAAGSGHLELVRYMLDEGARINHTVKGQTRCFALTRAAREGHLEVVRLLVERGAKVNAAWAEKTALDHALEWGQDEIAAYLRSIGGRTTEELSQSG